MSVPITNHRQARSNARRRSGRIHWWRWLLLLALLAVVGWTGWVYANIHAVAVHDEAQLADAIAVFGAAEYEGRPSPVLRARLQHTLELYQHGIAPLIITMGGADDMEHTEGGVGRSFLTSHGVPQTAVLAETLSGTTEESVAQLAAMARTYHLQKIVVVSDATHLFRVREMCRAQGLQVFTSPRSPGRPLERTEQFGRVMHEVLSYTLWRLHIT
jgi:uncharacterized SAM-binding protein YcdF (DUF218 family)